ncbi:MAG: serine hydrolase [Acidobacteriota bacterium]
MRLLASIVAAGAALACAAPHDVRAEDAGVQIALTFDDLPWSGAPPVDGTPTEAINRMAAVLNAHNAPATGFVFCERHVEDPEPVDDWVAWGQSIGNHSWSHPDLNRTAVASWVQNVVRCHNRLEKSRGYNGLFRFPMLHQGDTGPKRDAAAEALREQGMRNAHVTVDTSDWILARYHAEAVRRGDARLRRIVKEAFLEHIRNAVQHADAVARRKLGRSVPHVLLLHANSLVEDSLDELLLALRSLAVEFVPLEQALADPVYSKSDRYVGAKGISWLYRMEPLTIDDVRWDDDEATRIRNTLDRALAERHPERDATRVSSLPVGDWSDPALRERLEQAGSSERLHSILLWHKDHLVLEAYFNGVDEVTPANLKSVTKSITALLFGPALERGWIEGLGDPVGAYLEDHGERAPRSITLESLLTLSSGLVPVPYGVVQQQDDWVRSVLEAGVSQDRVGVFRYDTPVLQLLTAALEKSSGATATEIANDTLFASTSERIPYWRTDPQGIAFGGNDAYLTPRGMLFLGQLLLGHGSVNGERILSREFVDAATANRIVPPTKAINHGTLPVRGYGYLWWLVKIGGEQAVAAVGHGGQMILVVPSRETVAVVTSRWPMASSREHYQHVTRTLEDVFLPSLWEEE